jgi:nitrogenase molybdenum-iron protein alpha/beta subunit
VILTQGLFSLGSFRASAETEAEVRMIAAQYTASGPGAGIYIGTPLRQPGIPQMNMTTMTGFPQYGYRGIANMARLIDTGIRHADRPRSRLFSQVLYGQN